MHRAAVPGPQPSVEDLLPIVAQERGADVVVSLAAAPRPEVEARKPVPSIVDQLAAAAYEVAVEPARPVDREVPVVAEKPPEPIEVTPAVGGHAFERDARGVRWFGADDGEAASVETEPIEVAIDREREAPRRQGAVRASPRRDQGRAAAAGAGLGEVGDLEPPRLGDMPPLPAMVDALRLDDGLIARIRYSIRLGAVVKRQREALRQIGSALSRVRRQEAQCVETLGHAARRRGLTPPDLSETAAAAGLEERAAESRLARADERHREQREAEQVYETVRAASELRLGELEARHAPLASRRAELERRFAAAAARVDELRVKEQELRARAEQEPSDEELGGEIRLENERIVVSKRSRDEEVARREAEYGACGHELVAAEQELKATGTKIQATRAPLEKLEAEMARLRASMSAALEQVHSAEGEARVAAVAGKRRADFANRTAAELDREIGAAVVARLTKADRDPALEPFVVAVEKARERVRRIEARLNEQHDQLEAADEAAARSGRRLLVGASVVALAILAAAAYALSTVIGRG
jgi:hypothetical protein